ncbi:hypothetical protein MPTK1_4g07730 [Marchantia polymorpha subsp. ruderalis]|uniref:Uncharacterized protein n=2 Tax=Marchantia polymorpha TaxID=3197 RepID=A0AAF6B7I9_MARPO|nr:hypothetical protein MARPO_0115s0007 [Marchantia polymorpha]BBN07973.1 hypothetical protein Mp_4g07730 [Marchantia polymorpha subsp. ruderalis]|eukprot:PTQ31080.1 hypothetical protein MARPO_0115s0007 [Marchantia polymorpha]
MGTSDFWGVNCDDRVDTMYLANRHELLAYGKIMKRKSDNISSIKRNFMTFTRKLHGKLKAVDLSLKTFQLPRIRILFKCAGSKYHRPKERMTSTGGKNEGRNRCDLEGNNFLYHRLRPYPSNDEDNSW